MCRPLEVKVWGDFACFTRPEMKVERVTYPVMTPSAARGILEAIFWKPEVFWRVRSISVLAPIRYFSLMRNELKSKVSMRAVAQRVAAGKAYYAEDDRTQRNTLALRDVAYLIRADVEVRPGVDADVAKYRDQFRRRVSRGQCFHRPYLGCREFAAHFAETTGTEEPIPLAMELGRMLFDIAYAPDGHGEPVFFAGELQHGVLQVPQEFYPKVR